MSCPTEIGFTDENVLSIEIVQAEKLRTNPSNGSGSVGDRKLYKALCT